MEIDSLSLLVVVIIIFLLFYFWWLKQRRRNRHKELRLTVCEDEKQWQRVRRHQQTSLEDFLQTLQQVFQRCNISNKLKENILKLFNNFDQHEEYFLKMLQDLPFPVEKVLFIVIKLFDMNYFARSITYVNFKSLIEFVAKYLNDQLIEVMVAERESNNCRFNELRNQCLNKVIDVENVGKLLTDITKTFDDIKTQINEDNMAEPLNPDFSHIFSKVYHYYKHQTLRHQKMTVKEYFGLIRYSISLFSVTQEYAELKDVNNDRNELKHVLYLKHFEGRFFVVVKAYRRKVNIATAYFKETNEVGVHDGHHYIE